MTGEVHAGPFGAWDRFHEERSLADVDAQNPRKEVVDFEHAGRNQGDSSHFVLVVGPEHKTKL